MAESYEVESVVRRYHIYKEIWSAAVGTTLPCRQDGFNPHDSYAVAIIKDHVVVGHMSVQLAGMITTRTFFSSSFESFGYKISGKYFKGKIFTNGHQFVKFVKIFPLEKTLYAV